MVYSTWRVFSSCFLTGVWRCLVQTWECKARHVFFAPTGWANGDGAKRKRSLILEKAKSKPVNNLQAIAMCDLCSELDNYKQIRRK